MEERIEISLTKNESLVLFEFLKRFSIEGKLTINNQSEERVLWNLLCGLEKILVEPFQENYKEVLSKARLDLQDKNE
jgi:hypothetical protein